MCSSPVHPPRQGRSRSPTRTHPAAGRDLERFTGKIQPQPARPQLKWNAVVGCLTVSALEPIEALTHWSTSSSEGQVAMAHIKVDRSKKQWEVMEDQDDVQIRAPSSCFHPKRVHGPRVAKPTGRRWIPTDPHRRATQTRLLRLTHAVKCRRQMSPCRRQQLCRRAPK